MLATSSLMASISATGELPLARDPCDALSRPEKKVNRPRLEPAMEVEALTAVTVDNRDASDPALTLSWSDLGTAALDPGPFSVSAVTLALPPIEATSCVTSTSSTLNFGVVVVLGCVRTTSPLAS
mmetsp:Transcript_14765/g.43711  ORF Transcript_14765/g.43711 Transcript_14765/m.43711 type:complete len:125 (-) Transcript_14765:1153-1527(-)